MAQVGLGGAGVVATHNSCLQPGKHGFDRDDHGNGESLHGQHGRPIFRPADQSAVEPAIPSAKGNGGKVRIIGDINTPYRCIGNLIYMLQRRAITGSSLSRIRWRDDVSRAPSEIKRADKNAAVAVGAQATGASALGAGSIGALALGAMALGALAIGALAIGRLRIGRARIRRLDIDELRIGRITRIGD
ncbi:MAG: hypothetical protein ABW039_09485 [Sphingobium sp.]